LEKSIVKLYSEILKFVAKAIVKLKGLLPGNLLMVVLTVPFPRGPFHSSSLDGGDDRLLQQSPGIGGDSGKGCFGRRS